MFKISISILAILLLSTIIRSNSDFTYADTYNSTGRGIDVKLVRIRSILESLNYTIEWNELNKTVLITKNNRHILINYNENYVFVDSVYKIKIPIYLINNSIFLNSDDFDKIFDEEGVLNFIQKIGVYGIINIPVTNSPVLVAVLDSGINLYNDELVNYITQGTNIINENSSYNDDSGHGTNVAGIIAEMLQYTSNPSNIKIIPVKVLDSKASGKKENLVKGIYYAIDHGAKIICLALGTTEDSLELRKAIQYAEEHNVTVVAATGNYNNSIDFPACYSTVIGVGAIDENGERAPLSNSGNGIDIVAQNLAYSSNIRNSFSFSSGTSMAAAQVAGGVAILLSKYPDLKPYQVRSLLRNTTKDIKVLGWDKETGYGLLDMEALLKVNPTNALKAVRNQPINIDIGKTLYALLGQNNGRNSYLLDFQSEGILEIKIEFFDLKFEESKLRINLLKENKLEASYLLSEMKDTKLSVKEGTYQLEISLLDENISNLEYKLTPNFLYTEDIYEGNDSFKTAFSLGTNNTINANIHRESDMDWYVISVKNESLIQISTSVINSKLDPIICFYNKKGAFTEVNLGKVSEPEMLNIEVSPGSFYFAVKAGTSSLGAYSLHFNYDNSNQEILISE